MYTASLEDKESSMLTLAVCGQVIMSTGMLFFNAWRSSFKVTKVLDQDDTVAGEIFNGPVRVILVSFLAAASGALMIFIAKPVMSVIGKSDEVSLYDPLTLLSCLIGGLVSISASCGTVTNESGIIIGGVGTFFFMLSKKLLIRFEVDDGLNQVSVHAVCGFWGLLAAGIFDQNEGMLITGQMRPVLNQLIGATAIIAWVTIPSALFFVAFKRMSILRVGEVVEIVGLDYLERERIEQSEYTDFTEKSFLFENVRLQKLDREQRVNEKSYSNDNNK